MVGNGLGTGARADLAAGVALQELARAVSPPNAEDLPALDASALAPGERARSRQLLVDLGASPNLLATLDAALGAASAAAHWPTAAAPAAAQGRNGQDADTVAAPTATQR